MIVAWTLGILSNVGKFSFIDIFRTFRKTASPSWSWICSNCSDSDCVGAAGPFREGLGLSSSRLLILSGRTALDQLMYDLSQVILVRKTSLPTPPRLIRCRRTLEHEGPETRIYSSSAMHDTIRTLAVQQCMTQFGLCSDFKMTPQEVNRVANLPEWTTVLEVMIKSRRADLAFRTTKQERWNQ